MTHDRCVPFCLWFTANVDLREWADYAGIDKRNHYFHSSSMVLLRKKEKKNSPHYCWCEPNQLDSFLIAFECPLKPFSFLPVLQPWRQRFALTCMCWKSLVANLSHEHLHGWQPSKAMKCIQCIQLAKYVVTQGVHGWYIEDNCSLSSPLRNRPCACWYYDDDKFEVYSIV